MALVSALVACGARAGEDDEACASGGASCAPATTAGGGEGAAGAADDSGAGSAPTGSLAGSGGAPGMLPVAGAGGPDALAGDPVEGDEAQPPPELTSEPEDDAAFLWDDDKVRTYELIVADADLARLDADPAAEEYVPAELLFENDDGLEERYGNAAVRYKGGIGAFVGCTFGPNPFDPSGPKVCPKLSMKVSLNEYDPEGRFHGLKKLQFHAMNADASLMRERLGYGLFRAMGVAAPRAVHARLLINGEFAGLFVLVENIDGRFTRSRFGDGGEGNLYKEIWPKWTEPETYRPALETNEDEPDVSFDRIVRFARALEGASGAEAVAELSEAWMGNDYVLATIAVDRAILNEDGFLHWYCGSNLPGNDPGRCANHNYFWYEESVRDRLWLVPWDLDRAFRGANYEYIRIVEPWDDTEAACTEIGLPITIPIFPSRQLPTSCDPLSAGWASLRARYRAQVQRLLDGPFQLDAMNAQLDAWSAQLEPLVQEAAAAGHAPSAFNWSVALSTLRGVLDDQRTALEAQVR